MDDQTDFYEDDEPVEKIRAVVRRGPDGVTKRPRDLNQRAAEIVREATDESGVGIRLAALREDSIVAEGLHFGGYGATALVVTRTSADTATVVPV